MGSKTPYERSRDAAHDLFKAAEAYANAYYEHDTQVRGITPYGAYKDTMGSLDVAMRNARDVVSNMLQTRVVSEQ